MNRKGLKTGRGALAGGRGRESLHCLQTKRQTISADAFSPRSGVLVACWRMMEPISTGNEFHGQCSSSSLLRERVLSFLIPISGELFGSSWRFRFFPSISFFLLLLGSKKFKKYSRALHPPLSLNEGGQNALGCYSKVGFW